MLALYDTAHNKLCGLDKYSDYYIEKAIGSGSTPIILDQLHFSYALEDPNYALIDYECYISNGDAEFVVKEVNLQTADGTASGPTWVEFVCDANIEPIQGTRIDDFNPGSAQAEDAANLALAGTGWAVGYCDVTKTRTVAELTQTTVWDALNAIASMYNCDVTFDTINKYVIIHQKVGTDRGAYFAEQLNLKTLQIQGNSRSIVTRLYPRGKDGMTIASVNSGVEYVSNYQYMTKVVEAYWIDNRYTVASDMLADTQDRLAFLSIPLRAYSATIVDLSNASAGKYDLLAYDIGDTIALIAESIGVREQQRIVKIDWYPDEPEKSTCEIANRIVSLDDIILRVSDAADTVSAATDGDGNVLGSSVSVTNSDGTFDPLNVALEKVGTLIAAKVSTDYLQTNYLTATQINSVYATISNLDATNGNIANLQSNVASINTLLAGNITASNIKAGSITADSAVIANGAITTAMIATGAITNALIANAAISTAQIADASITDAKVISLTANKLTAGTIDASKITVANLDAGNITTGTIDAGSGIIKGLTSDNIKAGAITASSLQAGLITANSGLIANSAIDTAQIADASVTDGKIVTLTANKLTAGTIDAGVINVINMNCANLTVGTINGTQIASGTITSGNLAAAVNNAISTAQSTADGKNKIYYQSSQPPGGTYKSGDIWFNTGNGNAVSIYNGSSWALQQFDTGALTSSLSTTISTANSNASAALANAATAQTKANSAYTLAGTKNAIYYQSSQPSGGTYYNGDVWYNTGSGNAMSIYNGSAWVLQQFDTAALTSSLSTTISTANSNASSAVTSINNKVWGSDITTAVNGLSGIGRNLFKNSSFSGGATTNWSIWANGTTNSIVSDSSSPTGYAAYTSNGQTGGGGYYYPNSNLTQSLVDGVSYTISVVAKGNGTLLIGRGGSGKTVSLTSSYTTYSYTFTPTSSDASYNFDFYPNSSGGYAYIHSAQITQGTVAPGWSPAPEDVANGSVILQGVLTGSQIAANTISATNLIAGTITSTQIASNTITGNNILAGTITASNIQSATITATQIASRTILASNIVSGAITSNEIAANTITANNIQASTITSAKIAAATITGSNIASQTISAGNIISATITATQIAANTIQGGNIAAGTITASNIQSATITTNQIAANTITGGNIQAGTITGTNIAANTITTNNLLIGSFDNLIQNSNFNLNTPVGSTPFGWSAGSLVSSPNYGNGSAAPFPYAMCLAGSTQGYNTDAYQSTRFSVEPGEQYFFSFYVKWTSVSQNGRVVFGFSTFDANGNHQQWPSALASASPADWTNFTGNITIPSGIYSVQPFVSFQNSTSGGNVYISDVICKRMGTATYIADGAITTDKIVANAITAAKIAANTITSNQIASNTITAANIQSGTITSTQIAAGTITGSNIQANTISSTNIVTGTITATQIASNTITGTNIASQTITASNIQSNTITANQIASNTITANQIASNTITASQIASGTITSTQIASGTITAGNINVSNLVQALNVSTYILYAQELTTTGSTVYGTIGDISSDGKTGFKLCNSSGNLLRIASGAYGDDGSAATIIDVNGALTIKSDISTTGSGASMFLFDGFSVSTNASATHFNFDTYGLSLYFNQYSSTQIIPNGNSTLIVNNALVTNQNGYGGGSIYLCSNDGVQVTNPAHNAFASVNCGGLTSHAVDIIASSANVQGNGFYRTSDSYWGICSDNVKTIRWSGSAFNFYDYGSGLWWVYADGASDERLKSNIVPSATDALSTIRGIRIVDYTLNEDGSHVACGVSAQDLMTHNDKFGHVFLNRDGVDYYSPNWDAIHPYTLKAVQQLAGRADDTDAKITALKSENDSLRSVIADLYGKNAQLENRIADLERKVA